MRVTASLFEVAEFVQKLWLTPSSAMVGDVMGNITINLVAQA